MRYVVFAFALALSLVPVSVGQGTSDTKGPVEGTGKSIDALTSTLPELMRKSDVPGMSIAVIDDAQLVWNETFGVVNSEGDSRVSKDSIFEGASLTKPVVAYAIFKLVDEGVLALDVPLNRYLGNNYDVGDDKRLDLITARHVLGHTSGFPNWRNRNSKKLPINFTPGEKFSYSGEGFVYLSKVVEKITGKEFGDFVKTTVLRPLGMNRSSIDWEEEFFKTKVFSHDALGKPRGQNVNKGVNAAASLHTTAEDYARFVIAVLNGTGLSKKSHRMMLEPHVRVAPKKHAQIAWGLGWGLETREKGSSFWHWGDNGFSKAFIIADTDSKNGLVFFANGANGLSFLDEVLTGVFGRSRPSSKYIDYERFDSPSRILFKEAASGSAEEAIANYLKRRSADPESSISERQMNRLGYNLLRVKKVDAAIAVFRQNTKDFPKSANTWDSLAEGYMVKGDNKSAIYYYKKSLELDPENKNAAKMIEELEKKQKSN